MKKPPIIFVHGYRGSHAGLAEVASFFKDYEMYNPDVPPAGGATFDEYDMPNYVNFIVNYIKKNNIKKPVLAGHSLGSMIVSAVASEYPELINEKIVLLAPISKRPAKVFGNLVPLTAVFPPRLVDYLTTKFAFVPKDKVLFKKTLQTTHQSSGAIPKKDIFKSGKFSAANSVRDFPFKKQTAIVVGEKDRLIPLKYTQDLAKDLNAKLTVIPGTGHLLNYENPEATAMAIREFLEQ